MKDFSIIIPIYNCEVYLTRCINSIISQKIDNYEIILVNDGSTDNSSNLCHKFSKENKNIIVIDKENTGVSDSRNIGLEKAKGKYILFLDADDYLDKGYFEKINLILKEYPDIELINFGFFSDVDNEKLETVSSDKINYKPKKGGVLYKR